MNRFILILAIFLGLILVCKAETLTVDFTSASVVPVTASSYTATGNNVAFSLGFAPPAGTNLTIIKNTGLPYITGHFSNLNQGQVVDLTYGGKSYRFVANYYGGSGNDLVLHWAYQDLATWGLNNTGQLGNNTTVSRVPVLVNQSGVLAGKTVVSMNGGHSHSVAVCSDGTIAAWGDNSAGELGTNCTVSSSEPVLVDHGGVLAGKTVVSVAVGSSHTVALCSDGTLSAWGFNNYGQLGNNSTFSSRAPLEVNQSGVLSGKAVVSVAAGYYHNLALCSDGTLVAWGRNDYGQLGNGSTANSSEPVLVDQGGVLAGKTVVSVAAGSTHCLALCSDGTLVAWGRNDSGQLGNNSTVSSSEPVLVDQGGMLAGRTVDSVAAGSNHSLALCSDGTLATWGFNNYGQLGDNSATGSRVPVSVIQSGVLAGKKVVSVAAGDTHSLASCSDGTVAAWGRNHDGQLGNNGTSNSSVPVLVNRDGVLADRTVVSTAAGPQHVLSLCSDGTLVAWGDNGYGQLGNNINAPVLVSQSGVLAGKTVVSLAVGGHHSLALCSDGTLVAWGFNRYGQLGNDSPINASEPVMVIQSGVLAGKTVVSVAAGGHHSVALCSDGTLAAWGFNNYGQLGNNSKVNSLVPTPVNQSGVLAGKTVVSVAAGSSHTVALCSDGTLVAWGYNYYGQLGNTSTTSSSVPVLVNQSGVLAGRSVVSVAAGFDHGVALCSDGALAAWGRNHDGQLGNNGTSNSSVPVLVNRDGVLADRTVVSVVTSVYHNLALCSDGMLVAWGANGYGQLGNTSTTSSSVPVLVDQGGFLTGKAVVSVAAGLGHSLAVCSDGTLAAWGLDEYRQLGNNGVANSSVPVPVIQNGVLAGKNVVSVTAGYDNSLVLAGTENSPDLVQLSLSLGVISPQFDPVNTSYNASVMHTASLVNLSFRSAVNGASIRVNGNLVTSSLSSQNIPLEVGSNLVSIVVTAPDGVTTKMYSINIDRSGLTYSSWKFGFFTTAELNDPAVSGEQASPVGDGIGNLMKYALVLEPKACGTAGLPIIESRDGYLTMTYRKNKQATDLIYEVQVASGLSVADWSEAASVVSQIDEGDHWLVTVRDNVRQTGHPKRFMRLKVTK